VPLTSCRGGSGWLQRSLACPSPLFPLRELLLWVAYVAYTLSFPSCLLAPLSPFCSRFVATAEPCWYQEWKSPYCTLHVAAFPSLPLMYFPLRGSGMDD
jgi:hypothetical protein